MQLTFQSSWSPCIRSFGKCLKSINIQQNNWTYRTLLQHSRLSRHTPFRQVTRAEFQISEDTPFDANPLVIIVALLGWTLPASIPSNIPILHGPALDDPFWLYMVLWHVGLFIVLFFGTIGYGISKNRV
ncbi:Photosystem I subunit O [Galdieria sulphuraria]|nr:Photosystem I subunit O [Galdieria sulphuraria]